MLNGRFTLDSIPADKLEELKAIANDSRGDILKMTTLATCGHPGGSMSSLEMYLVTMAFAKLDPQAPLAEERDRLVISHGHTSPAVYSLLGRLGYFDVDDAIATFRLYGSPFEGHIERAVPGVEWGTGNLGQGLSVATGFALANKLKGIDSHTYCFMGDGEQQKGQISEARRFAIKHELNNVTAFIDYNRLQLSGPLDEIMPQNIEAEWKAAGWRVESIDGHDMNALYATTKSCIEDDTRPAVIIANTVMSKGVSWMEDKAGYHGMALKEDELAKALTELNVENDLDRYKTLRSERLTAVKSIEIDVKPPVLEVNKGTPRTVAVGDTTDNRSAWGNALVDIAEANPELPMAVFDCDLAGSVKTGDFKKLRPEQFIQAGISEHHAASSAGACSADSVLTWWADFGAFGVAETYNMHRLTDINNGAIKIVCTHCGLDVGEDGKTHQAIDYVGVFANTYGIKLLVPADPNQTDRAIRYAASTPGSFAIIMGRSKLPIVAAADGTPAFTDEFEYGRAVTLRSVEAPNATVIALGQTAIGAVEAADELGNVNVLSIATPLLLDKAALKAAAEAGPIITVEDHNVNSGLGTLVARELVELGIAPKFKALGVSGYGASGKPSELYAAAGIDAEGIKKAVTELTS